METKITVSNVDYDEDDSDGDEEMCWTTTTVVVAKRKMGRLTSPSGCDGLID